MIRFDNVTKRYAGSRDGLSEVSLSVDKGEMVFLTGHSGAGKTTLLKLIALIERPTRGQVLLEGRNIGRLPARAIPQHRRRIGMVFQDHKLLPERTVFENVSLPLIIAGMPRREIARRVRAAIDQVGLLGRETARPDALSTGEQQRVGIARAVVTRPGLLIADEPTGNLDPALSLEIMTLFKRLNQVGVTMLIATHDLALLDLIGGRRVVLAGGRVSGGSG